MISATSKHMKSVLFVCLGNICRSPACEGIARHMFDGKAIFDSAGIDAEIGSSPDYRSISVCKKHGIDISGHCGRQIDDSDWSKFDLIAALDKEVLYSLESWQPKNSTAKLALFDEENGGVDDPWYGNESGFVSMYDQIEKAMPFFLKEQKIIV